MKHSISALLAAMVFAACQSVPGVADEQIIVAKNGDARLRVFSEGSGPSIVLLPGRGRGPRDFDTLSKSLVSVGFRVIRPEPRGFGESTGPVEGVTLHDNAADVAAAIEATSAAPAIVGGWAYRNRVARMLATERPQLVRGLVLIAAGGKFAPKPEVLQSVQAIKTKVCRLKNEPKSPAQSFMAQTRTLASPTCESTMYRRPP